MPIADDGQLFHLGDILSVMSGRLLTPNGLDGVQQLLSYLTGDDIFTHQIPRALTACGPVLRKRYPGLAAIPIPDPGEFATQNDLDLWLAGEAAAHGGYTHLVRPLAPGIWQSRNPVEELADVMPNAKIIVVSKNEESS
jgi:hypothetical protein